MDRLLSLSQAARMVGVTRRVLQQQIQDGLLDTFEGQVRMSELLKVYPEVEPERSGMVEKVRRLREAAFAKGPSAAQPNAERLAAEVQRLRIELSMANDRLAGYEQLAADTRDRLLALQERCDRRQALLLGTLIGWYMHQVKLRASA